MENANGTSPVKNSETVDANEELKNKTVFIYKKENADKKILFVGNSITLHEVNEKIGWYNACGMAASKKENDYVHVTVKMLEDAGIKTSFCICQVSGWEVDYANGSKMLDTYKTARDFDADIIVMNFVANCPRDDRFDLNIFEKEYNLLIDYLNKNNRAKVFLCTDFWGHRGDEGIIKTAEKRSFPLIVLKDLGADERMRATGLFEHKGVAKHPGDLGMKNIAERIFDSIMKNI